MKDHHEKWSVSSTGQDFLYNTYHSELVWIRMHFITQFYSHVLLALYAQTFTLPLIECYVLHALTSFHFAPVITYNLFYIVSLLFMKTGLVILQQISIFRRGGGGKQHNERIALDVHLHCFSFTSRFIILTHYTPCLYMLSFHNHHSSHLHIQDTRICSLMSRPPE